MNSKCPMLHKWSIIQISTYINIYSIQFYLGDKKMIKACLSLLQTFSFFSRISSIFLVSQVRRFIITIFGYFTFIEPYFPETFHRLFVNFRDLFLNKSIFYIFSLPVIIFGAGVTLCGVWIYIQILHLNFTTKSYLFTNVVTYHIFFISSFFLNKSK